VSSLKATNSRRIVGEKSPHSNRWSLEKKTLDCWCGNATSLNVLNKHNGALRARSIGQRLLTYVDIREEIDREIALRCQKLEINADYVIQGIKDIVERSQKVGQWATTLKGYELLGKYLKLFTDKTELTGEAGSAVRIILHGGKNDAQ
jgi:hypothetical protein